MAKKTKRKSRAGLIIILLLLLGGGGALGYFILNPSSGRLKTASIEGDFSATAVVIREEAVATAGDIYHIRFLVAEGEAVSVGQQIATLYNRGYEIQFAAIIETEQSIYRQQLAGLMSTGTALPDTLVNLNAHIDNLMRSLVPKDGMEGDVNTAGAENELCDLLITRRELMLTLIAPDAAITNAIAQLDQQYAQLKKEELFNEMQAGYISFYVDGYEEALRTEGLTATQISKAISSSAATSFGTNALYRIVTADNWYLAFNVKASSPNRLMVGMSYEISYEGEEDRFRVNVISEKVGSENVSYILAVDSGVYDVLSVRKLSIVIHNSASGVSVPLEAIMYESGVPTVYIKSGEQYVPIAVNILASDEDKAVISAANSAITLTEGLRFEYHEAEEE